MLCFNHLLTIRPQLQIRSRFPQRGSYRHRGADDRSVPGLHGRDHPLHAGPEAVRQEHLLLPGKLTASNAGKGTRRGNAKPGLLVLA